MPLKVGGARSVNMLRKVEEIIPVNREIMFDVNACKKKGLIEQMQYNLNEQEMIRLGSLAGSSGLAWRDWSEVAPKLWSETAIYSMGVLNGKIYGDR